MLALHLSLLAVLCGGGLTAMMAQRGELFLPLGVEERYFGEYELPQSVCLDSVGEYDAELLVADGRRLYLSPNGVGCLGSHRLYFRRAYPQGVSVLAVSDPWGIGVTYAGYLLFAVSGLWLVIKRGGPRWVAGLAVCSVVAAYAAMGFAGDVSPLLRSPWLAVHVSLMVGAYLLLLLTWCGFVAAWRPLLRWGAYLLGLGIVSGAMWANVSWGGYWQWDPKETWALVSLGVYVMPLHVAMKPRLRRAYLLLAPLSLAITYFGVNLLESAHAY